MKVKFNSKSYYTDFPVETEDGYIDIIPKHIVDNGEIVGEVIEERKTRFLVLLPDGNKVFKKKSCVEILENLDLPQVV
jgi:hypothetical protein